MTPRWNPPSLERVLWAVLLIVPTLGNGTRVRAQDQPASGTTFTYEVASIKPDKSGTNMVRVRTTADAFSAENVPVKELIRLAYHVQDFQISGGPGWIDSDHYDIEAKMDPSAAEQLQKLSQDERMHATGQMLQALLAERFQLKLHRESREFPIYALVVAKNGPKLHGAVPGDTYPNGIKGPDGIAHAGMMMMGRGQLTAQALPISSLVQMLSSQLSRTVLDKTGLTGKYDIALHWAPDDSEAPMLKPVPGGPPPQAAASADSSGPSIFTALQEQLGLKLESQKGPVEVLIIDHVERPSEN